AQAGSLLPEVAEAFRPLPIEELAQRRLDGWDMGSILLALQVAASLLAAGLSYAEALPWLIRQGGDTDTHGAIVGALLGARDGVTAIPEAWRDCVADRDRILQMADRLLRRSGL
ncbi:MAG: ADP-ribosylglycohydrolase family protein, partial [Holophagaceae bacterium]